MQNVDCGGLRNDLGSLLVGERGEHGLGDDKPAGFMLKEFPTFQAIMIMGTC